MNVSPEWVGGRVSWACWLVRVAPRWVTPLAEARNSNSPAHSLQTRRPTLRSGLLPGLVQRTLALGKAVPCTVIPRMCVELSKPSQQTYGTCSAPRARSTEVVTHASVPETGNSVSGAPTTCQVLLWALGVELCTAD